MSDRSRSFRKMGRLVFRLANHWQPQYVVMGDYDFAPYAYAGCNSTLVRMIDDYYFDEEEGQRLLVVLDPDWLDDAASEMNSWRIALTRCCCLSWTFIPTKMRYIYGTKSFLILVAE